MECLQYFLKNSKAAGTPFNRTSVSMFTEHIAKRSFPTLEFAQMQIKGGAGEVPEAPNELLMEKAWLIYSNLCKIGQEFTASKSKVRNCCKIF